MKIIIIITLLLLLSGEVCEERDNASPSIVERVEFVDLHSGAAFCQVSELRLHESFSELLLQQIVLRPERDLVVAGVQFDEELDEHVLDVEEQMRFLRVLIVAVRLGDQVDQVMWTQQHA